MATKLIGLGGDYSTVGAWITYLQGIGTLTEPEIGLVLAGFQTSGNKIFQSITTTTINRVTLRGQEPYHNNQPNSISARGNARLIPALLDNIVIRISNIDIFDLEIIVNGSNRKGIYVDTTSLTDINIARNIIHSIGTGANNHGIHVDQTSEVNIFRNIIKDFYGIGLYLEEGYGKVYNNTVYNCDREDLSLANVYEISHDVYDIVNNLSFSSTTADYVFTLASHTFNAGGVGADIPISVSATLDANNSNFIPANIDILFTGDNHLPSPYTLTNWGGVLKDVNRGWCIGAIQLFNSIKVNRDF